MWTEPDLKEIRAFLTLSEDLHFTRTADRLGITPARVSQLIRTLETRVGEKLFERTSRRVRLTPTGEQLKREIARPYQELQAALMRAHQARGAVAGTIRIGTYTRMNCGPHWLQITQTFKARHPGCDVELVDTGTFAHDILEHLRAGEVEILVSRLPVSDADITVGPVLSRERRVLLVARDDPLAAQESVGVEDFADRPVTDSEGAPREMMNAFVPPVTPSGRTLRRINLTSFDEVLMRVAAGELVHPTVASFLSHYVHDGVVAVPIRDLRPSETALLWLASNRSAKTTAFARAAEETLADRELLASNPSATTSLAVNYRHPVALPSDVAGG
jgi:DNA-binding transcriptional LysR family regulator